MLLVNNYQNNVYRELQSLIDRIWSSDTGIVDQLGQFTRLPSIPVSFFTALTRKSFLIQISKNALTRSATANNGYITDNFPTLVDI